MPYKKYIKRGGKVYGPYIYHSKRVNGKVVSEYHGVDSKKIDYKKFLWIGLGILIVMLLIFGIYSLGKSISGKATYDLEIDYKEGEAIDGILKLSLKEGELLPSSSKLLFENNENSYEYVLSDIVSEEIIDGDFYLEGKEISGSGTGYGIEGTKESYPIVYFTLEVYSKEKEKKEKSSEEETEEAGDTSLQNPDEETEEPVEEVTTTEEEPEEEVEEPVEETSEEEPIGEVGITGQAISFIFGWMTTGNIVMELETEINGEVSAENPFIYNLNEGEEVEIKSKSVRTDFEELKDNVLNLNIEENQVTVTTGYSEKENGFGENYIGEDTRSIKIDLSDLNLILDAGNLKVSLVYSDEEIISLETNLQEGTVKEEKEKEEAPLEETEEIIEEIPEEVITPSGIALTEEEKAILIEEFGSINIKTIREEIDGGRLIIGHQLRDYKIEHSYDYPQNTEELREQINADVTRWLRDIVATLSKKQSIPQKIDIIDDNYVI